jgi:3-oxoadipate enol-lactonase
MPTPIAMPKLGMSMQEGTVVEWRFMVGNEVGKGAVLLVIESEKSEVEIESPAAGFLRHVYIHAGELVPCGTMLAALTDLPDEPFDPKDFRAKNEKVLQPSAGAVAGALPGAGTGASPANVKARAAGAPAPTTPAARKRAKDLGVDVEKVPGSGPGGRVTREDVEAYAVAMEARVAVAPDVSLEVSVTGAGDPVVLLPGFGTDASAFAKQIPELAEHFEVRAVNPRGVGFSDAPDLDRYSVPMGANDTEAVIGSGPPAHVVGASLGAAVAIEFALLHPERVRSLTLITPFVTADPRLFAVIDAWCRLAAETGAATLGQALLPWLFSNKFLADAAAGRRAASALAQMAPRIPQATLLRWAAGMRDWSGTREANVASIEVPTLIVAAGDDLLTPGAEELAARLHHAKVARLPDAGHAVTIEAADGVTVAIEDHLAAVE